MAAVLKIAKPIINENFNKFLDSSRIIQNKILLNCIPTNARINKKNCHITLIDIDKRNRDYYNYTKSFDGAIDIKMGNKQILYNFINTNNLKDNTIIENNYNFIEYQLKNLNKSNQYIYLNMFWGPYYLRYNHYFEFLLKNTNSKFKNQCFIGDLECVNHWLSSYKKFNNL